MIGMPEQVVNRALELSDSIFLVLLVGLALWTRWITHYTLRSNDEREKRYIEIIEAQSDSLQKIDDIRNDVREIKQWVKVNAHD